MNNQSKPIKAILIGAGQRGADVYGAFALKYPELIKFVAVAEPNEQRRLTFANAHAIPEKYQFESWEPLLAKKPLGQAAIICTQDQYHVAPAITAMKAGYDVLLEKPMATTLEDCHLLVNTSEETGKQLHICHVLRYTKHFQTMKNIVQSGEIGDVINFSHRENVSWWHMAHSFVRGSWRNQEQSSPMILAKCCHDLDLFVWILDRKCKHLSSVGSLKHFRPENAPPGAPQYCLDGCPAADTCPYYAPFIYIDLVPLWQSIREGTKGFPKYVLDTHLRSPKTTKMLSKVIPLLKNISDYHGWPQSVVTQNPTPEKVREALKDSPYGRCVYHCDNNVVDHQVMSMWFEDDISVTLTMHGHAHSEARTTRIEGTKGTLLGYFGLGGAWIETIDHRSGRKEHLDTSADIKSGHGGGDEKLMEAFINSIKKGKANTALTTAKESLESHLMAFAAEKARREKTIVYLDSLRKQSKNL